LRAAVYEFGTSIAHAPRPIGVFMFNDLAVLNATALL
jgi:hypothetical protein